MYTKINQITTESQYKLINCKGILFNNTLESYGDKTKRTIQLKQKNNKINLVIWNEENKEFETIKTNNKKLCVLGVMVRQWMSEKYFYKQIDIQVMPFLIFFSFCILLFVNFQLN